MLFVALLFAFSSTPVTEQAAPVAVQADQERKVCQKVVATGTIMSKRVCKTVREWESERAASQRALQRSPQHRGQSR